MPTFESVLDQFLQLDTHDKLRLIERVTPEIENELHGAQPVRSFPSLWGIFKGSGAAPSAEEIDETRQEMWAGFPRDDL